MTCIDLPTSGDENAGFSHADSLEARDLALWFTGDLVAPESLVTEYLNDLKNLREAFKDRDDIRANIQNLLANRFLAPWTTNNISVKFDSSTAELVRNSQYNGWNNLDPTIRPDSVSTPDILGWCTVNFLHAFNPWRLSEQYITLPGVLYAEPNGVGFAGGTFPIFPGSIDGEKSFMFVANYIYLAGPYYYFYYQGGIPTYGGIFDRQATSKPFWWDAAKMSIDSFSVWQRYKSGS